MPETAIYFYQEENGEVPVLEWLDTIRDKKAIKKCFTAIRILGKFGYDLRCSHADYEGYSIAMLRGIAHALNKKIKIEFVPLTHHAEALDLHPTYPA